MSRFRPLIVAALLLLPACTQEDVLAPTEAPSVAFAQADCALAITNEQAIELIDNLISAVDALEAAGALNAGQARALRNHLQSARAALEAGKACAAKSHLKSFRQQVSNFHEEGLLTDQQALPLTQPTTGVLGEPIVLPYLVTVDVPSSAAGEYGANYAVFGPSPTRAGVTGALVIVNDGTVDPTFGCEPLVGFPAGAIALVDRGGCFFMQKAQNAEAAGAVAVIVLNNSGNLGAAIVLGAPADLLPPVTIPAVSLSQADGAILRAGLPATGKVSRP